MILTDNRLKNHQRDTKMRKLLKAARSRGTPTESRMCKTSSRPAVSRMKSIQATKPTKMPYRRTTYQCRHWNRNLISLNS